MIIFTRLDARCCPMVGFAQPTVSRHLKVLTDCGILKRRKDGNRMLYSVTYQRIYDLIDLVNLDFIESLSKNVIARIRQGY